jgi:hypothetical protein
MSGEVIMVPIVGNRGCGVVPRGAVLRLRPVA